MRDTILIVDDMEINREILVQILKDEYELLMAKNGKEALAAIEKYRGKLSAVLLDLLMPELDGFGVLKVMREKRWIEKIPVLIITGEKSAEAEEKCFDYGISDFIRRPFENTLVKKRVHNIVKLFQYQNQLEQKVEKQTEALQKQNILLRKQAEKLYKRNENLVDILGTMVEYRSLESGEHIRRVKGFTEILATQLMEDYPEYGLTEQQIKTMVMASSLHDVGKIAIPDSILLKPGRLTADEFEQMKQHSVKGSEIIDKLQGIWDEESRKAGYDICRYHHERYDGRGYPDGLLGEEIPVSAQVVSIADVYDALVSERVYKAAYSKEKAFDMITSGQCGAFSPKLLECFRHVRRQFEEFLDAREGVENVS